MMATDSAAFVSKIFGKQLMYKELTWMTDDPTQGTIEKALQTTGRRSDERQVLGPKRAVVQD